MCIKFINFWLHLVLFGNFEFEVSFQDYWVKINIHSVVSLLVLNRNLFFSMWHIYTEWLRPQNLIIIPTQRSWDRESTWEFFFHFSFLESYALETRLTSSFYVGYRSVKPTLVCRGIQFENHWFTSMNAAYAYLNSTKIPATQMRSYPHPQSKFHTIPTSTSSYSFISRACHMWKHKMLRCLNTNIRKCWIKFN